METALIAILVFCVVVCIGGIGLCIHHIRGWRRRRWLAKRIT